MKKWISTLLVAIIVFNMVLPVFESPVVAEESGPRLETAVIPIEADFFQTVALERAGTQMALIGNELLNTSGEVSTEI